MPWYDGAGNIITPTNFADLGFSSSFASSLFGDTTGAPAIPEAQGASMAGALTPPVLVDTVPFMPGTPDPFPPETGFGGTGQFGTVFSPPQTPPIFGPIFSPDFGGTMPPFLPAQVPAEPGMIPSTTMPQLPSTTMPGQVRMVNGRCVITRFLPARTVNRKARIIGCNAAGPICVPARRRMNALNPHALSRALRRASKFAKFARKAIKITTRMKLKKGFRGGGRKRKKAVPCAA